MFKLILIIILTYFGYKLIKLVYNSKNIKIYKNKNSAQIEDNMIQDPVCGIYFTKKDSIHIHKNGTDLFFCSQKCKDKYLEHNK